MLWLLAALIFMIGAFVGGLINITVLRIRDAERFTKKATCKSCLTPIAAADAIPIISFLRLKGRCRQCSAAIPGQYLAIELLMGVVFTVLFLKSALLWNMPIGVEHSAWLAVFVRDAVMAVFLTIIFVYDFKESVILDRFTIPAMILTVVFNIALGVNPISILLGGLTIGAFFGVQFVASDGHWVGGGDIRLGMLMGFLLGPVLGIGAVILSYILGAIVGLFLILAKHRDVHSHMPFGTFLSVSTLIFMIFGSSIFDWYLQFLG